MTYCPLDQVEMYLRRFVAYPSEHALVAHVLWIAHTHLLDEFDTTARLAFMSEEPQSGKTRALEVTELFVADPLSAFSASAAVIIRLVAARRRTLLYDEIDAVFGNSKRQEGAGDLCSFMNAGYRRGAKSYRCATGNGSKNEPLEFDAFAPLAVAGLRNLPDALTTRAIIVRMQRRSPDEDVEPFRCKHHPSEAKPIKEGLVEWCEEASTKIDEPKMPPSVVDRAADIWEPLIAIADVASGDWPERARAAAVAFTKSNAEDEAKSFGVELLEHIKDAFGPADKLWSETIIEQLCKREESPWSDIRGKPLDQRGLAKRLKGYGIKSKDVRCNGKVKKGYEAADFDEAWKRYIPPSNPERDKRDKRDKIDNKSKNVAHVALVADIEREERAAILQFDAGLSREEAEAEADLWAELDNIPPGCERRPWRAA